MSRLKQITNWIWYPWLMGLYPVLFLYARNQDKVYAQDFYEVIAATLLAVAILVGISWLLVRNIHKAAAMTAAVVIPFFTYGHIALDLISGKYPDLGWLADALLPLMIVLGIGLVLLFALVVSGDALRKATPYLSIVSLVLVLYNGLGVINEVSKYQALLSSLKPAAPPPGGDRARNDAAHPDIYYIILDAYPSNSSLMDESKFDNSAFTEGLEERGFFVAYDSMTNYPITLPSLASSLNMRYLSPADQPALDPTGLTTLRTMIADNLTAQKLQNDGYTYYFMMSGYDRASTIADISLDFYPDGPHTYARGQSQAAPESFRESFWFSLVDTTMLRSAPSVWRPLVIRPDRPLSWNSAERALAAFDTIPKIADMPEATFAFIHIIKPHYPVDLTADGEIVDPNSVTRQRRKAYLDQLTFVNDRTLEVVDEVLARSSVPPIIIIQGDHGSRNGVPIVDGEAQFYRILNAYYFPGGGAENLARDITPVNSFRVMFNTYFGEDNDLLENRHYALPRIYQRAFEAVEIQPER